MTLCGPLAASVDHQRGKGECLLLDAAEAREAVVALQPRKLAPAGELH